MTNIQKALAVSFLIAETTIFNGLFCDWKAGLEHRQHVEYWAAGRSPNESDLIASFGPIGIYARGYKTVAADAVLGVCIPLAFIAAALLVCTAETSSKPERIKQT